MISERDLHPGDLLFGRGKGLLSRLIMEFDGGNYSHAGLYLDAHHIAQARKRGLDDKMTVKEFLANRGEFNQAGDFERVDVYRLKQTVDNVDRVLKRATEYIRRGSSFAWEELALIGILRTVKAFVGNPGLVETARRILDRVEADSELLTVWARHSKRRYPMICSEFAYRCYVEPYPGSIKVPRRRPAIHFESKMIKRGFASAEAVGSDLVVDLDAMLDGLEAEGHLLDEAAASTQLLSIPPESISRSDPGPFIRAIATPYSARAGKSARSKARHLRDRLPGYSDGAVPPPPVDKRPVGYQYPPPNFVSPGDLAASSSLCCIGRLKP